MSKSKTNKPKKGAGRNAGKSPKAPKKAKQPLNDKPILKQVQDKFLPEQKAEVKTPPVAESKKEEKKSTDEVPSKKSKRDFSTFKFNGEEYNKGRLVRAIISKYAQDRKPSFNQLKEAFPDSEIKPYAYGLFRLVGDAKKINDESRRVRFFVKAGEEIKLKDKTIAVTNQITGDLLDRFLVVAKKHRYVVK